MTESQITVKTDQTRTGVIPVKPGMESGSLLHAALASLSVEDMTELRTVAAKEVLRLEVKRAEYELDYSASVRAIQEHADGWQMLDKQGRLTRQKMTSDIATGAGKVRIESKSGATCFVATAAYGGEPNHPDVMFLRWFRDNVLNRTAAGRIFIKAYWTVGPALAWCVYRLPMLKRPTRLLLGRLIARLRTAARPG